MAYTCPICGKSHFELSHLISAINSVMPSRLISQASAVVAGEYRKTQVDSLLRTITKAGTEVVQLADNPVSFLAMYSPVIRSIQELLTPQETDTDAAEILPIYREIRVALDEVFADTENRALYRYVRIALVAEKTRVVAQIKIATTSEADALRTEIVDEIDELMIETPDDATFQALASLKVAVVAAVDDLKKQAQITSKFLVADPAAALAVAYRVYGDASRADEIIERNAIKNPALISGGTELEVLA